MNDKSRQMDQGRGRLRTTALAIALTAIGGLALGSAEKASAAAIIPIPSADLLLTKSHFGSFTVGRTGDYTLQVHNNGPSTASGPLKVTDTLPAGLSFAAASGVGWTCTSAGQVVTCTNPTALASGASSSFILTVRVGAAAAPSVTNRASVSSPTLDPVSANNAASDLTTVIPTADLALTKSHTGSFVVGQTGAYTLTVHNNGLSPAAGPLRVTDVLPNGLSFAAAAGAGWTCTALGQLVTCTNPSSLAAGASSSFTMSVRVGAAAAPGVINTASVSSPTSDPNSFNNRASDPTTVIPVADLTLVKSHAGSFTVGRSGSYLLTVRNNGPNTAAGPLTVKDTLPGGLRFVSAAGGGWSCGATGQLVTCTNPTALAVGASSAFFINVAVDAAAAPGVTNTATVSSPTRDPNSSNNTASDPTTVIPSADLALSVTDSPDPVVAGHSVSYVFQVRNNGPSAATGITFDDPLPLVGFFTATPSQGSCTPPNPLLHRAICSLGTLAAGASATVTVVEPVPLATSAGTLSNTGRVSSATGDPNVANNAATASTRVIAVADLAVTISDSPDPVVAGQPLTYTLQVHNNGPSTATGVSLTDALPAGASIQSATSSQGSCTPAGATVNCSLGSLSNGVTATITIKVTAPAGPGTLTDTASVSAGTSDPVAANNTATATTLDRAAADLAVTMTDAPDPVTAGQPLTYTLQVRNNGPSTATSVALGDALPAGVSVQSVTSSQGSCSTPGTGVVTCQLGSLANGAAATVTIVVTAPSSAGAISAMARVSGAELDLNMANNTATAGTTVIL